MNRFTLYTHHDGEPQAHSSTPLSLSLSLPLLIILRCVRLRGLTPSMVLSPVKVADLKTNLNGNLNGNRNGSPPPPRVPLTHHNGERFNKLGHLETIESVAGTTHQARVGKGESDAQVAVAACLLLPLPPTPNPIPNLQPATRNPQPATRNPQPTP